MDRATKEKSVVEIKETVKEVTKPKKKKADPKKPKKETKGKKKSGKSKDNTTMAPGGPAQSAGVPGAQSMPNPRGKDNISLPKALQDADGGNKQVNTVTALLHYELNDHPGKSINKSLKSMKTISKFADDSV